MHRSTKKEKKRAQQNTWGVFSNVDYDFGQVGALFLSLSLKKNTLKIERDERQ
jgi:hypothetical protein